jgi:hypothetical protein
MGNEPQHMPHAVLAAAIPVLIYSLFCLSLGVLLVTVLHRTRDGFNCESILASSFILADHLKMLHCSLLRQRAPL